MATTIAVPAPAIEADALDVLTRIQDVLNQVLRALPGPFERPSQVQHCLNVDAKVAWNLFKLTTALDPLAAAKHVPGRLLMKRIGKAAMRKGVAAELVESAQDAIDEFEAVVKQHASTRTAFKAIVATIAGDESAEGLALQHRHAAFNVQSQLWGEQVDLHYTMVIFVRENERNSYTSIVTVKRGLQLLRPDAMSELEGCVIAAPASNLQALEPEAALAYGTALLPAFCSQPVPQFVTEKRPDGWHASIIQNKNIGRQGAVDLAFGRRAEHDAVGQLKDGTPIAAHGVRFLTPTSVGVIEVLVHRPSYPAINPEFGIFGDQTTTALADIVEYGRRLPLIGSLSSLGNAATVSVPPVDGFSSYEALQQHVFSRLGWNRAEFDLYRVNMTFPIMHTIAAVWFKI